MQKLLHIQDLKMTGKLSKKGRNPGVVDNWLDNLQLYRKNVAYDETCLFRAVSEQLFDCQVFHERVRKESIEYGLSHYEEFSHLIENEEGWNRHLNKLEKHMVICGNLEIHLISRTYNRDVLIFHANQQQIYDVTKHGFESAPLMLCLMDDDHYDAIYRKEQIINAGFCQSIVYKILYEEVFDIPDVDSIVTAMLYEKTPVINQIELEEKKQAAGGTELKPEDLGNAVVAPFPFKVAKALDPSIYRNIEYDSWGEVRRELRLGDWYYGDDKLKLGTRCVLNDEYTDEKFDCYIQELHKDEDKCVVYLTKTAEKRVVKYSNLSPESDAKPWPLPYRFSKNLVISTTQLASMDKIKTIRKKNKEKRQQSKSVSDLSNVSNEGLESVSAFVGAPLQMQNNNNNECSKSESTSEKVGLTEPPYEGLVTPNTPDINHYPQRYQWEQVHWPTTVQYAAPESTFYSQSPEQFVWPQGPTPSYYEYKPMVASAPVTPSVVPYHDTTYPYYYNYQVEHYSYPLTPPALTPIPQMIHKSPENSDKLAENFQQIGSHQQFCNEEHNSQNSSDMCTQNSQLQRSNVTYVPHTPQPVEAYPSVLNLPPAGAPVIYAALPPSEMEMIVSPPSMTMYASPAPMEVPYIPPSGYLYSSGQNVPAVPWFQPAPAFPYNSQGFVFPSSNPQAK